MNHVTTKHQAEIDGKRSYLAGCTNVDCPSHAHCLRGDPALDYRVMHRLEAGETACRYYIPVEPT